MKESKFKIYLIKSTCKFKPMDTRSMKTVNANPTRKPLTKTWHLLIALANCLLTISETLYLLSS